jgi:hypothetical protein
VHPTAAKALFDEEVATLTPQLAQRRQWVFHGLDFPVIDCSFQSTGRTTLRIRMTCEDWNDLPPAINLHAADGSLLTAPLSNPSNVFHPGPHPATQKLFICMRGSREYHTHPSHVSDPWDALKGKSSYTLGGILTQIWNAWQKGPG